MEDKIFDLIEKMYTDLKSEIKSVKSELKSEIQSVRSELKSEIQSVRSELKSEIQSVNNHVIIIEQDHGAKLDALLDGYKQLAEGQVKIEGRVDNIEKHMVNQDDKITFLNKVK
jgi:DNA repair exonuclease SbcCD ATPase subunit